jgi:hypothetical protein
MTFIAPKTEGSLADLWSFSCSFGELACDFSFHDSESQSEVENEPIFILSRLYITFAYFCGRDLPQTFYF